LFDDDDDDEDDDDDDSQRGTVFWNEERRITEGFGWN
jgi:hypothetical protein